MINVDDWELTGAGQGTVVAEALQAIALSPKGALQILLDGGA
jgi:hypothetical protein